MYRTPQPICYLLPAVALCAILGGQIVFAQSRLATELTSVELTAQQQTDAITFAREHHPELADLVVRLEEKMTDEYDKAVRQLFLTHERLSRIKERSDEDYRLQLSLWKVDSRIKLHAARMTITADPKLERQMRELLQQRADLKLTQLHREREKLQTRLERTEKTIQTLEQNRNSTIDKELERFRRLQPKTKAVSTRRPAKQISNSENNSLKPNSPKQK